MLFSVTKGFLRDRSIRKGTNASLDGSEKEPMEGGRVINVDGHWSDDKRAGGENREPEKWKKREKINRENRECASRETCGKQVRWVKTNKHRAKR